MKLCEAGCEVSFTKFGIGVEVRYRGQLVLEGSKCLTTGLWMVPLDTTPTATTTKPVTHPLKQTTKVRVANNVTDTSSQAELAMYHRQLLGSPPKSTLLKAIKNHSNLFDTFPGLSYELINKHLPLSTATTKGHMIQKRQGLQSTNRNREVVLDARRDVQDMSPKQHICTAREDELFCYSVLDNKQDTIYSDLTGQFPVWS